MSAATGSRLPADAGDCAYLREDLRERERRDYADREIRAWRSLVILLMPFSTIGAGVVGWLLVRFVVVAVRGHL